MVTTHFALFFFNGASASDAVLVKTGTGGIDPPRIYKPTGLEDRKRKPDARVQARVEESREIHAEVAGKLARELNQDVETPVSELSLLEIDQEIGRLLRKVKRTQDEEILLLMLMVV